MKKYVIGIIIILVILIICAIIFLKVTSLNKKTINYEVINDANLIKELDISKSKSKKYEIIEKDESYYIIVHNGEETVYYSHLEVKNVTINNDKEVTIEVKLPEGEGIGEAFSYPIAVIKLNERPTSIKIIY